MAAFLPAGLQPSSYKPIFLTYKSVIINQRMPKPAPNIKLVEVFYPDSQGVSIGAVTPPPELKKYILQLDRVKRFNDQKFFMEGLIPDNTLEHTIRCAYRASTLHFLNDIVERMIWIHDIPEIMFVNDVMATERSVDPLVAKNIATREKNVASRLLKKDDFELHNQFQIAEELLRSGAGAVPKTENAILAKLLDLIDGNLTFHYYFADFLGSNDYTGKECTEAPFGFTLESYKLSDKVLNDKRITITTRNAGKYLLDQQLSRVLRIWEKADQNKIPSKLKETLKEIQEIIDSEVQIVL